MPRRAARCSPAVACLLLVVALGAPCVATAKSTERVDVASTGEPGAVPAASSAWLSADGRYVAFSSDAPNLVAGDTNASSDVFVRDRLLGLTDRVSVGTVGEQADGSSTAPAISADGRYVAFMSTAPNLVAGDQNGRADVFVRDLQLGTTDLVSVTAAGTKANDDSRTPTISDDGRYVAFQSLATNLVTGDTNGGEDAFVKDRMTGAVQRVNVRNNGGQANTGANLMVAEISGNGCCVAFAWFTGELVAGDTNGSIDVFVRDRVAGTTERVSVSSSGAQANDASNKTGYQSISDDGRYVTFESIASNLVPGDTNSSSDGFVRDRLKKTTTRVTLSPTGEQLPFGGSLGLNGTPPAISPDGRHVAYLAQPVFPGPEYLFAASDWQGSPTYERVDIVDGSPTPLHALGGVRVSRDARHVLFGVASGDPRPGLWVRDRVSEPVGHDDDLVVDGGALFVGAPGVLANDDAQFGGAMSAQLAEDAEHGELTLGADGGVQYIPDAGFTGTDRFRYRVFTDGGTSPPVTATIRVEPALPGAVSGAAAAVTGTSASLGGSVDPNGVATNCTFEYGTSLSFGQISPIASAGSGDGDVAVSASLAGLAPATTYYWRLVASSAGGTAFGTVRSFRTTGAAQRPVVVTGAASSLSDTSASLAGQVNPRGQQTAFTFEYGPSMSFGSITPVVALDDADAPEQVSAGLSGLTRGTTYYYRLVATNASGTTMGAVSRFDTPAAAGRGAAGSMPGGAARRPRNARSVAAR